jgi:hypothetical protein
VDRKEDCPKKIVANLCMSSLNRRLKVPVWGNSSSTSPKNVTRPQPEGHWFPYASKVVVVISTAHLLKRPQRRIVRLHKI